jgi:hypothetical protein
MSEKKKKFQPVQYADLKRGQMFTVHGSRTLLCKHSDAVCFDSEGNDVILSLGDPCYPKRVDNATFQKFERYLIRQDNVGKSA